MKKTRLRDVPKGKRWSHFWHYYGLSVFLGVFLGGMVLYTLYLAILKPPADLAIMILSDRFDLSCETAIREELGSLDCLDVNGDGTVRLSLNYVPFDTPGDELPLEDRMELMTILSAGNIYVFLANEDGSQWLSEQGLLGTWGDFNGTEDSEPFAVPVKELPIFQGEGFAVLQHLTLYIACPPEDGTNYQAQMAALRQLLAEQ